MTQLNTFIQAVSIARQKFIQEVADLSHEQSCFKLTPETWSICENVEHMVWAERAGTYKMWMAIDAFKQAQSTWEGEAIHQGQSIEQIIAATWRPKETVPDIAKPRWGGPIDFWITSLTSCQSVLEALGRALDGLNPEQIIYPHPISGPLNMYQRIDFLRFHLERHQGQVKRVKAEENYPSH